MMAPHTIMSRITQTAGAPRRLGDAIFHHLTRSCALFVLLLVLAIGWELWWMATPAIETFGLDFIFSTEWNPVTEMFGAGAPLFGTVVSSFFALLVAVPVSLGIAIFLTQMTPGFLRRPIGMAVELLAAIPSIIYGLWGLFVLSPWLADHLQPWLTEHLGNWPIIGVLFQGPPMGIGIFCAALVLSIMVIPFMASVLAELFDSVPVSLKEASFGLGSTRWEMVTKVVLPHVRVGVIGAFMLGLGRALGETMAVTFVIGNAHRVSPSLFEPGSSIASTLANEFTEATGDVYLSSLMYLGLVLFLLTFVVLVLARLLLWRLASRDGVRK